MLQTTPQTMTWRTFLDEYCRRMKPSEKQEFASQMEVSQTTINRWRRGKDSPRARNLEHMLTLFSEDQREQFLALLSQDPKMWSILPIEAHAVLEQNQRARQSFPFGVLDHFCLEVLRLQRDTPDRFWQVSGAVLREALTQLETHPEQTGLEIQLARCMPPRDGKVRSLRATVAIGTSPWRADLHYEDGFFGMESLAGCVVARRHGEMIPLVPTDRRTHEQSVAAFPIMRDNAISGALLVSCAQPEYFTPERMDLIEICADLIRLALYDEDFYPADCIDLGFMPSWTLQRTEWASFRSRVVAEYRKAQQSEAYAALPRIEDRVRGHMEEELLNVAASEKSGVR